MTPALVPVLLALGGAFLFGVSNLVARFGLQHGDARLGSLISIGATAAFYWLLAPVFLHEAAWTPALALAFGAVFALIGLVSPSISLFLAFEGNRQLGPTVSGTIASSAPLFAACSAILVLGERMTPLVGLGTLGIVLGVMVLSWQGRATRGWPLWAVLLPLGAAFLRGGVQVGSKFGFALANAPFAGALVTFSVSFVAVWLAYRFWGPPLPPGGLRGVARSIVGGGLRWFVVTGVLNGMALLLLYMALSLGRVVVVSPVVSTYPLFTLALSLGFRVERLGLRIFAGVVLVISGVVAVSTQ